MFHPKLKAALTRCRGIHFRALTFALLCSFGLPVALVGQNINTETPFHSFGDSYYENHGVNFGFSIPGGRGNGSRIVGLGPNGQLTPNLNFSRGGGGFPPFGGYSPNSGGTFGFGRRNPNGGGFSLGLNFAKGSNRSSVTQAPNLTVQNGFGGSIFSGEVRPFVTSVTPIIGNGGGYPPPIDNGVTRALNSGQLDLTYHPDSNSETAPSTTPSYGDATSTATQGDLSVSAIKARRKQSIAAQKRLLKEKLDAAQTLVDAGEFPKARTAFRAAMQLTKDESIKRQIKRRIEETRTGK